MEEVVTREEFTALQAKFAALFALVVGDDAEMLQDFERLQARLLARLDQRHAALRDQVQVQEAG